MVDEVTRPQGEQKAKRLAELSDDRANLEDIKEIEELDLHLDPVA